MYHLLNYDSEFFLIFRFIGARSDSVRIRALTLERLKYEVDAVAESKGEEVAAHWSRCYGTRALGVTLLPDALSAVVHRSHTYHTCHTYLPHF